MRLFLASFTMTPSQIICFLCLGSFVNLAKGLERQKRELRFPKGGSLVAAVALASFLPKGPTDGFAHVLEFDLGFPFPEEFSIGKKPQKKVWKSTAVKPKNWYKAKTKPGEGWRKKRNLKEDQKKDLLLKLEDAISRIGFNGFSCVSRFRCELREVSPKNSLLEQLLVALFATDSQPEEEDCERHRAGCRISLLQIMLHSEQISSSKMV